MATTRLWTASRSNPSRVIAGLGDSITAQGFGGSLAGGYTFSSNGYLTWAAFLSKRRVKLLPGGNFGVSGETSTQILARVGQVVSFAPGVCVVLAGTNDIATIPVATTIANLAAIYDALQNANIAVIAIPIMPRGSLTTAQYGKIHQINRWIYGQRISRRRFIVVDMSAAYGDPLTGAPRTTMSSDQLHPLTYGAYVIGNELQPALAALFPDPLLPFSNILDLYSATDNPTGNLLASGVGLMVGTTGTLSNGPTGSLATSWSANGVNLPAGATAAFAKTTKADGRALQQLTLGGTYNSASPSSLNVTSQSFHANVVAGDTVQVAMEFEADAGIQNLGQFALVLNVTDGSGNPTPIDMQGSNAMVLPPVSFSGIVETPPVTLPITPTNMSVSVRFTPTGVGVSSTLAAVCRFGSADPRKIV